MINKEEFIDIIKTIMEFNKELDRWDDFGIEVFELPLGLSGAKLAELTYTNHFTDKGIDTINWWLYERVSFYNGEFNEIYDKDGDVLPSETIEDLWELVKDDRK